MNPTSNTTTRNNYANWMSTTPHIDSLKVGEFVWPGCHNAAMDWDIGHSFPESASANWALCQNHDLLWQMRNGARSFDLRMLLQNNEFNKHLSFAQLKKVSRKQRVILSIEYHEKFGSELFWPAFKNRWEGSTFVSVEKLAQYVTEVMQNPPSFTYPWRLSMTQYTAARGPTKLTREINTWFDMESYFLYRSSIISVDFFDESRLVEYCIGANSRLVREPHLKRPFK
jgi:hypothetical protein